ncbi:FAD-dependent oxidoreductase [Streptomyces sp. NPDC026673]|uniref:FAD-dependent oxidoreductase n=1 Tax=Streptomyces sp. NPDC026673 TaxID=3155724 RepID=UPI0033E4D2F3
MTTEHRTDTPRPGTGDGTGDAAGVLVVGAGPTGLLLAGDLAAAGVPVTVLERRAPGHGNLSRAFGVHARTLELLDARGLADELVATGHRLRGLRLFRRLSLDLAELPSRFPYLLITPQYEVERLLERRARAAGVRFEHGAEVLAVRQDGDGVALDVRDADGTVTTRRAAYAVGTDGHRSAVRTALGLPFPGRSVIRSIVLADVRLAEPPEGLLTVNGTGDAFAFIAPFGDGWYRVMCWDRAGERADGEPVGLDEVRDITRRALGTDHGMAEARWLSRFHSDERQVPVYRTGRVFLAGDAAHVHSPAGGQGMNTGLQDAANLGWKLAAVARGRAADALLDTYQAERHPVGGMVLRSSGGIIRLAMAHNPAQRAFRDLVSLAVGHLPPLRRRAMGAITGIGIAYPAPRGAHPLTGERAPDLPLREGRLYEALRAGRFVLVSPAGEEDGPGDPRAVPATRADGGRTTLLVRPDGYIAWAADGAGPGPRDAALTEWVGAA